MTGTIIVGAVLLLAVAAIIKSIITKKRRGISSCSCGGNCSACGGCKK